MSESKEVKAISEEVWNYATAAEECGELMEKMYEISLTAREYIRLYEIMKEEEIKPEEVCEETAAALYNELFFTEVTFVCCWGDSYWNAVVVKVPPEVCKQEDYLVEWYLDTFCPKHTGSVVYKRPEYCLVVSVKELDRV